MTVKKKPKKKPIPGVAAIGKTAVAEEKIEDISRADLKKMVAKVAESKSSYREIADEIYKKVELPKPITQPTIGKYLEEEWGKDFQKKKEEMSERRSMRKKWNKNFELVRLNVGKKFHKDYISSMDGMMYNREENLLGSIPVDMSDTQWKLRKRDIINFSKERMFGYTPDMKDLNKLGVYDPSVISIVKRQLRRRIFGLAQDEYKRLEKKTFDDEMETRDMTGMDLEEKDAFQKKVMREVRRDLKPERAKMDKKAEENFKGVVDTLQREGIDNRSATLLGRDMLERKLCPAFSSSDKKYRGKQRMFAKKGIDPKTGKPYVFSNAVYNIPDILWSHPKRLQIMCNTDEVDVLTENGWKNVSIIAKDDNIATLNKSGELEYQKPINTYVYDYDDQMIRFKKNTINIAVTPEHKMYVGIRTNGHKSKKWFLEKAEDLIQNVGNPRFIKRDVSYIDGIDKEYYLLPEIENSTNANNSEVKIPMNIWLKFIGSYITDGYKDKHSGGYRIIIAAPTKERWRDYKIDIVGQLAKILGFKPYITDDIISIQNKQIWMALEDIGHKAHNKQIPRKYLSLNKDYLECLFEGLIKGDGYYSKKYPNGAVRFCTVSEGLRDDMMELSFKLGYVASYKLEKGGDFWFTRNGIPTQKYNRSDSYMFSITRKRHNAVITKNDWKYEHYKGKVYCIEVPNHIFYVRANGKPHWTGNSHNLSKRLPELLHGEEPIVKGKENSIKGINLRVRFPRNSKEDILTREAGIVITEAVAKKFRYFNVVEKGHIIAESVDQLPQTWRVNKPPGTTNPIETHDDFKSRVAEALEIQRGDPLTFSSFKDLDGNPGYKEAKHSGQLIYLGKPREKERSLTVDKDKDPQERSKIDVNFITQEYIIIREDDLKRGDKIISRNGLKGVISEIVPDLGKDEKKRPYEIVVNLEEVWREADPKDPEYKIQDDTFFKQGKKKSGVVKEHKASDGQIFFFLIDKMAQDQSTSGLRMSTTMLSGLWEWFLYDVMGEGKRYTQAELNSKLEEFVGRYFGERGTFVPSLKAMHYKAVKKGDKIRVEIDEREPLPDRDGEVIYLPHTYAGRTYEYAYIPNFISRIYFDGSTLREYYQIDSSRKGTTSASGYYYQFIVRQIKNRTYIFPRNEDAVNLVAVPYYGNKPEDYDTVIMDLMDFINAGGNPYDKNLTVTFRKEPVTGKDSIQTHPVKIDKSGEYQGCIAIHPSVALKATVDYDGDQVVVFTPAIDHAKVKLTDDELKGLVDLKKKVYTDKFSDYYKKAEKVKYAKTEEELGVRSSQYNQETGEIENTKIQQLGGLRKRSLVFYGSKLPEPVKYGSKKDPREKPLTPEYVNQVCDVEKILKMREPRWLVRELEKTNWDDLTKKQKDLVEDYHIRRELGRRLQKLVDSEKLERLMKIIQNEKSFIEDNRLIDRGTDPKGLEISLGNRLVDRVIWQQLKGSDILTEID